MASASEELGSPPAARSKLEPTCRRSTPTSYAAGECGRALPVHPTRGRSPGLVCRATALFGDLRRFQVGQPRDSAPPSAIPSGQRGGSRNRRRPLQLRRLEVTRFSLAELDRGHHEVPAGSASGPAFVRCSPRLAATNLEGHDQLGEHAGDCWLNFRVGDEVGRGLAGQDPRKPSLRIHLADGQQNTWPENEAKTSSATGPATAEALHDGAAADPTSVLLPPSILRPQPPMASTSTAPPGRSRSSARAPSDGCGPAAAAERAAPPRASQQASGAQVGAVCSPGVLAVVLLTPSWRVLGWVLVLAMFAGETKGWRVEKGRRWRISRAPVVEAPSAFAGARCASMVFSLPILRPRICWPQQGWDTHGLLPQDLAQAQAPTSSQHEFSQQFTGCSPTIVTPRIFGRWPGRG